MAHPAVATIFDGGLEVCGPSQPTAASFHGADGADALQRIGQQWRSFPLEM